MPATITALTLRGVTNLRNDDDPEGTEIEAVDPGEAFLRSDCWYALYFTTPDGETMLLCDLLGAHGESCTLADATSLATEMATCLGVPLFNHA